MRVEKFNKTVGRYSWWHLSDGRKLKKKIGEKDKNIRREL